MFEENIYDRYYNLLEELREKMLPFIELQEQLLEIDETKIDEILEYIQENQLTSNKTLFNEILQSINLVVQARPLNLQFYIDLLLKLKDDILINFSSNDLWHIFRIHKNVLLSLYEEKCIDFQTVRKFCYDDKEYLKFFFVEVKENDEKFFNERIRYLDIEKFFIDINIEEFKKKRKVGHSEWEVARIIRNDSIDEFQNFFSQSNMNLTEKVPPTIFESDEVVNSKFTPMPTLIEYAAFFNSVNIFKFLWMNLQSMVTSPNLPKYAICGGCYDLIHICEKENQVLKFDEECVSSAIEYHHMEIVDYLHDSVGIEYTIWLLQRSIRCFNLEAIFIILEADPKLANASDVYGMTALHFACERGHLELVKFLLTLKKFNLNFKNWILK